MPSSNDLMKFEQLAKRLDVSTDTIQEWKKQGMPYIKIGKFIFVSWNSFHRWAKDHETESNRQDAPGQDL